MPLLALGLAAALLIVAGVAFLIVRRRRRPKNIDAVPLQDLPVDDTSAVRVEDSFAPPAPEPSSFEPALHDAPALETPSGEALVFERVAEQSLAHEAPQTLQSLGVPSAAGAADVAKVSFRMLLPTQGHARSAAQIARRDGYVADVQPPANGEAMWLCLLTREMAASPAAIGEEMTFLAELAGSFGGRVER